MNSAKGAVGIMKKVSYWVVIAMAFGVAQVLIDFGTEIGGAAWLPSSDRLVYARCIS
ncbi:MAG: phage holin family protein [Butyricicoccaceae bacterium]